MDGKRRYWYIAYKCLEYYSSIKENWILINSNVN
jgi:hypothetical protein